MNPRRVPVWGRAARRSKPIIPPGLVFRTVTAGASMARFWKSAATAIAGVIALGVPPAAASGRPDAALEKLRLDQIQVIGTHNSYQQPIDPRVMAIMGPKLRPVFESLAKDGSPEQRQKWEEAHPNSMTDAFADPLDYIQMPIEAQLNAGVRSLELDLQPDPNGGLYADPLPHRELRSAGAKDLAPFNESELRQPGMKVFHLADVDFRSQCPRLRQCLTLLRQWSDAHPGHGPIFILLEPKMFGLDKVVKGAASVAPFDKAAFDEVDAVILHVLGRDRVFTPDDLRAGRRTLEEAALAHAWPTLGATRDKFLFLFIAIRAGPQQFGYLAGRPSLEGRMAFVEGQPGMAHTAFVMADNALVDPARVAELVRKGYLVRSRADIDTGEARRNDARRRDVTLATGAQIISTDYPFSPGIYGNDYQVRPFDGGYRCNPVAAACPASSAKR